MKLFNMPDGCIWSSDLDYYDSMDPLNKYNGLDEPDDLNEWFLDEEEDWTA